MASGHGPRVAAGELTLPRAYAAASLTLGSDAAQLGAEEGQLALAVLLQRLLNRGQQPRVGGRKGSGGEDLRTGGPRGQDGKERGGSVDGGSLHLLQVLKRHHRACGRADGTAAVCQTQAVSKPGVQATVDSHGGR